MLAVIITGALRNLETTWPINKVHLDDLKIPYKVFVHTWSKDFGTPRKVYKDQNSLGFTFSFLPKEYHFEARDISIDTIHTIIPDATVKIEEFDSTCIQSRFSIPPATENSLFQNMLNSAGMYIGISRGFQLALQDFDCEHFTHFIRIRTDFKIQNRISHKYFDSDLIFCGPGIDPGYGYISDQFFICKSHLGFFFASIESELLSTVNSKGWYLEERRPLYGETVLSYFLSTQREIYSIEKVPPIGSIKRPKVIRSEKRLSLDYLNEIFRYNHQVFSKKCKSLIFVTKRVLSELFH